MANGLVYTQVREGAGEGLRVKRSLAHKVRKVKKVHAGPPFSRTVYTNKGGGSLLRSFQRSFNQMEEHISALRNQVTNQGQQIKDQDQKIKDQGQQIGDQGQQIEDQGEGQKLLNKEVMTLNPLKDTAISIRKRLFATYRWGGVNEKKDDDEETINIGNIQAHTGNVRLDVHLFRNNLIEHDDSETFLSLYGTSWERAEVVTESEEITCLMNKRATTLIRARSKWRLRRQPPPQWTEQQEADLLDLVAKHEESMANTDDPPPPNAP